MPQLDDGLGCTIETCSLDSAAINYIPTLGGNVLFLSIFGSYLLIQTMQAFRYQTWSYSGSMTTGLALETAGYVGRIQMHYNPFSGDAFLTYIVCLTIGPVFFAAAIYLTLSRIIVHFGPQKSRFTPKTISLGFMTCDAIALILQAVGGALANEADDIPGREKGTHIMVAGLGFQVLSLLVFITVAFDLAVTIRKQRKLERSVGGVVEKGNGSDGRAQIRERMARTSCDFRVFLAGMTVATFLILARSTFRVAELSKGFTSKLANEEVPFMILEGALIILAVGLMTAAHPGRAFGAKWVDAGWNWKKGRRVDIENGLEHSQPSHLMK